MTRGAFIGSLILLGLLGGSCAGPGGGITGDWTLQSVSATEKDRLETVDPAVWTIRLSLGSDGRYVLTETINGEQGRVVGVFRIHDGMLDLLASTPTDPQGASLDRSCRFKHEGHGSRESLTLVTVKPEDHAGEVLRFVPEVR
jgi:hypothetical protein